MDKKSLFRSSSEWKKLRKKIINRDKHCLICGSRDDLEIHHIIPLDVNWQLRKEKLNLITLCKLHHNQVHNGVFSQCYLMKLVKEVDEMIGKKFGKLTVISECSKHDKFGYKVYKCLCDCGNITYVNSNKLKTGNTKSCGCLRIDKQTKHGKYKTRLYHIYNNMKNRCCNEKYRDFYKYGGRGISICGEWLHDFMTFYDWSMNNGYKDNLTIDRIDVNGNYEPNNCRWATPRQQSNNRRVTIYLTYNGKTQTMKEWADELGVKYTRLYSRYRRKWKTKDILLGKIK